MMLRSYSFAVQTVYVPCLMLCFRVDGALSSAELLPHLCKCLCSAGTRHRAGCTVLKEMFSCFCTLTLSNSASEEGKAFTEAARLTKGCSAKQRVVQILLA